MSVFSRIAGFLFNRTKGSDTEPQGTNATEIHGGYITTREKNPRLAGIKRFESFENLIANVTVIGMSVWCILDLVGSVEWKVKPPEELGDDAEAQRLADVTKDKLVNGMETSWRDIVCMLAEGEWMGYSAGEWIAREPDEDGVIGMYDVERRAQRTIEQWDVDERGVVRGVNQRSPYTNEMLYIDRERLVIYRDSRFTDSPEGFGMLRLVYQTAEELLDLSKMEMFGFAGDLRGMPYARMPMSAMRDSKMTPAQIAAAERPTREFIENYVNMVARGLLHDSAVYRGEGLEKNPANIPLWHFELIKGGATSQDQAHVTIERKVREIARVLGTEAFLLGSDSKGSHALADNKTQMIATRVNGMLLKVRRILERELLARFWERNGWDKKYMPSLEPDSVNLVDVEAAARILEILSKAGSPLDPTDEVVDELRARAHMSRRPQELVDQLAENAMLSREAESEMQEAQIRGIDAKAKAVSAGPGPAQKGPIGKALEEAVRLSKAQRRLHRELDGWHVYAEDGVTRQSGPHTLKSQAEFARRVIDEQAKVA